MQYAIRLESKETHKHRLLTIADGVIVDELRKLYEKQLKNDEFLSITLWHYSNIHCSCN